MKVSIPCLSDRALLEAIRISGPAGFGFAAPLFLAALDRKIELVLLPRGVPWPARQLRKAKRPTLVVVADDDHTPSGPAGWDGQDAMRSWCDRVMIHAAGGTPETYRVAVANCINVGRYLLVETTTAHFGAWLSHLTAGTKKIGLDLVHPPVGQCHPIMAQVVQ